MSNVTSQVVIDEMLKKVAITAKVGILEEEWTEDECLKFIEDTGNKYLGAILKMDEDEFKILAMLSYMKSDLEIKKALKQMKEEEEEDD